MPTTCFNCSATDDNHWQCWFFELYYCQKEMCSWKCCLECDDLDWAHKAGCVSQAAGVTCLRCSCALEGNIIE